MFWSAFLVLFGIIVFLYVKVSMHRKDIREKIERRRNRRGAVMPSNLHAFSFDDGDMTKEE
jgi:heme exporter protein D